MKNKINTNSYIYDVCKRNVESLCLKSLKEKYVGNNVNIINYIVNNHVSNNFLDLKLLHVIGLFQHH